MLKTTNTAGENIYPFEATVQVFDFRLDEAAELVELLGRCRHRFALSIFTLHRDRKLSSHVLIHKADRLRRL